MAGITGAETTALITLARSRGAQTISIRSGRTPVALDAARPLAKAWERGKVALELSWPETAASWLRQAARTPVAPRH